MHSVIHSQPITESIFCALADRTVTIHPLSHSRAPYSQCLTAWDSASLSSGASGSVAVLPSPENEGFASNVVLEFPDSPFTMAPAVIATVRLAEGAPLGFAVTVSEVGLRLVPTSEERHTSKIDQTLNMSLPASRVSWSMRSCGWQATSSFAVLNLAVVGSPKAWTALVHVDWRAWPVGVANLPQTHNYEVHTRHIPYRSCGKALTQFILCVAGAHRVAASV